MGSQPEPEGGTAPQQALPPRFTRSAACPYFSFTASFMLVSLISRLLLADLNYVLRLHRLISSAAFRVQELQQLLQRLGVCRVVKKRALAAHLHQTFVPELV